MKWKNEALVGLVVVAGLLTALVGAIWLSGKPWSEEQNEVTATFRNVGALAEGNPVKYRGVNVGRVTTIRLSDAGDGVFVGLAVRPGIELPADAAVILSPESLFGDWQAQIVAQSQYPDMEFVGTRQGGVLPGSTMPDISELTAVAARIAGSIDTLSRRVQLAFTEETAVEIRETIENIGEVSDQVQGFIRQQTRTYDAVSRNVLESTSNIRSATATAELAANDLRGAINRGDIQAIFANARQASEAFSAFGAQLQSAASGFPGLMARADTTLATFGSTAATLDTTMRVLRPQLAEIGPTIAEARKAIGTLGLAMQRIQEGNGTFGRLLADPALYEETQRAIATLQRLLADIQANPAKYIGQLQVFE